MLNSFLWTCHIVVVTGLQIKEDYLWRLILSWFLTLDS